MSAYIYWRLLITSTDTGNGEFTPSVADLQFYDSTNTLVSISGGTASASSFFGTEYEADKAFDDGSTWATLWSYGAACWESASQTITFYTTGLVYRLMFRQPRAGRPPLRLRIGSSMI